MKLSFSYRAKREAAVLVALVLTVILSMWGDYRQQVRQAVCNDTLRLHILANSDTLQDQLVKLQVRDALLPEIAACVNGATDKQQAIEAIRKGMPGLQTVAQQAAGREQSVRIGLERQEFAARDYGTFALPDGTYTALRVELGAAAGRNWFCVLYPSLCVGDGTARYESKAENAVVFGEYELRFALVDAWDWVKTRLS